MPRVLLIEDSPTQAQEMAFLLEESGFDVVAVADAEQGHARLTREAFDIVLTDLVLPGQSGFDLCRRLKADPQRRQIPVVVLTSQADPVNVLRGLEAGADGFMTKNREPGEIIGRLRRTLEKPPAAVSENGAPTRVAFLDCQFELTVGRRQLLNVLLAAFEDVVHLNQQYQRTEAELRKVNSQLQDSLRSEQEALQQLKMAQSQLVQVEKLSALGKMVAGVAHEINNPLAFLCSNITVLERDTGVLGQVLDLYREADSTLAVQRPELLARIQELAERMDLPYILSNLEGLLTRSQEGLSRIEKIVKSLRDFAHIDGREVMPVDLNAGIQSTIDILRGEADKRQIEIVLDLSPLPRVLCYPTKIYQVVLSLVANALDACAAGGKVTVRSQRSLVRPLSLDERAEQEEKEKQKEKDVGVEIHVIDDGRGIDPAIRDKIFDPFFTTKPLGKGTGLGLSISYGIVKEHGGRISFDSAPGRGSHFVVWLPLGKSDD